ncbi:hemolysin family protein [Compostibacter hankyongensis]|uniref:Hemolysin family protein n=1 Tax=Compostibacter hankyongensis TaxID=1007089 RepID=A0ABP8FZ51_9BACT
MELIVILVLILLNGIFAMSEIALVSARKTRLEGLAEKGDKKARTALQLSQNPDRFLSTVQIGITLIGILTGVYSGDKVTLHIEQWLQRWPALQPYSHSIAVAAVVLLITYFSMVLGELLPKKLGLSRPEWVARLMAGPMNVLSRITFPFIWLLSASANLLARLFRIGPQADNTVTEEEIKAMISEGTTSGAIEETEQEIIERVFHLGDRSITSLMTHRSDIVWIDVSDSPEQYRDKIMKELHSVYPVCDGKIDELVGALYIKDLYLAAADTPVRQLMRKPLFIPENNTPYQVLEKFRITRSHYGFIVDEYGSFLGMLSLNDILEALVGDMPEVGEAEDYELVRRADGSFLVDAQIPFYDFLAHFDKEDWITDEEQQEFDTLAGFILHRLERIPQVGETLNWRGFCFEIVDMDGHRIDKILVKAAREDADEAEE